MLIRQVLMGGVMIVSMWGMTACGTPGMESDGGMRVPASATRVASSPVQSSGGGGQGGVPAASASEGAVQTRGQAEAGPAAASGEAQAESPAPGEHIPLETMRVYTDNTHAFSVQYPDTFVVRMQPAEHRAQFTPMPSAALRVMSPVIATSDLGDLEPADLEIRVYEVGQIASLENWLTSNGLLSAGDTVQPFQAANVSGVEVCASTMLAPGCSYFVLGSTWIYQLTPATQEGEAMMDTFRLLP